MRFLPLLLALLLPTGALAQGSPAPVEDEEEKENALWGWVDDGGWHFVDSLDLVPAAYRATATKMRVEKPAPAANKNKPPTSAAPGLDSPQTEAAKAEAKQTETRSEAPSRADRIAELEARLTKVMEEVAAMEEGNVPQSYLDAAGGEENLTNALLSELMARTEEEFARLESELERLRGR